ncbi:magnesium chelatase accessory protein [Methylocella silvestris BL2]|uniref:Magnesium chelatase accessory protein n=1 Tax=Methylocella silvestris (strain DSM 15510 / CIP 108128 / LMG 27833 / NCIMB 13906 / BL2) TaxID=395965 RepID=B8EQ01_METSB|nr:magnesium chelatase accessory protein [Methylocella silvestris BL2]
MSDRLDWDKDGADWPNRATSRFVTAGELRWHVQIMGDGPVLLLLHGAGSSTHSWRDLAPLLARRFTIVAPDLPGHGFTQAPRPRDMSTDGMAKAVSSLVAALDVDPTYAAGHSAGAAILCRMRLERAIEPRLLFSLNGALLPFDGFAGRVFSPLAKMMFKNTLIPAPRLFAWLASDRSSVERTLRNVGAHLDRRGVEFYARLFRNAGHVGATLGMMAHWDLKSLRRDLPRLDSHLVLVATEDDRAIPVRDAHAAAGLVPGSRKIILRRGGHLLHEERPEEAFDLIVAAIEQYQAGSASLAPSVFPPAPPARHVGGVGKSARGQKNPHPAPPQAGQGGAQCEDQAKAGQEVQQEAPAAGPPVQKKKRRLARHQDQDQIGEAPARK